MDTVLLSERVSTCVRNIAQEKMKKNIQFISLALVALAWLSCSKESLETIPVEPSFEDPEVALARYTAELGSAEAGWEFSLDSREDGFFAGYFDFDGSGNALFAIDATAESASSTVATAYHVAVSNKLPKLGFPAQTAFADFATAAQGVDTSFTFQAIKGDTIVLNGDRYGNKLVLTPTTTSTATAYQQGGILSTNATISALQRLPKYFKRIAYNGAAYDVYFNPTWRKLYIHYGGTERFAIHETSYGLTATGIRLQRPLVDDINVIGAIDQLGVDEETGMLTASIGGVGVSFTNEAGPSAYDVTAAVKFFNSPKYQMNFQTPEGGVVPEYFSLSANGFTVDGVPDAYGVGNIPDYEFIAFFHQFSGADFGGLRFYLGDNGLGEYGPAVIRQFSTPEGMIRFVYYGYFGIPPESIEPIITHTTEAFTDPNGFYVVKSGPTWYDLVSVTDGRKWIRFE